MSAVVLGALVVLWASVLVPMWLRRHDRSNEVASADRFAGAMRVLSRRPGARASHAATGGRYVMGLPRSSADHVPHVTVTDTDDFEISGPSRYAALAAEGRRRVANTKALTARFTSNSSDESRASEGAGSRPERRVRRAPSRSELIGERARKMAQRRRLVLAMTISLMGSLVLALVRGGFFIGLQIFVDVLVLAGFAHLRAEVVAERARFRRLARSDRSRAARGPAAASRPAHTETVTAPPAVAASYEAAPARPIAAPAAMPRRVAVPESTQRVVAEQRVAAKTTAPAVRPQRARTVDLTQPGKWSERQTAAANVAMPVYVTEELVAAQRTEQAEIERTSEFELDLILDRAVGE